MGSALELVQAGVLARHRRARAAGSGSAGTDGKSLKNVLATLIRACRLIAGELAPFLPGTAARIRRQCTAAADGALPGPTPVFDRWPKLSLMAAADIRCYAH